MSNITNYQNNTPIILSTIPGNSSITTIDNERELSNKDKKRKIDEVYSRKRWLEEDKYDI